MLGLGLPGWPVALATKWAISAAIVSTSGATANANGIKRTNSVKNSAQDFAVAIASSSPMAIPLTSMMRAFPMIIR